MAMRYYAPFPGGGSVPGNHGEPRPRGGPQALRVGDAERDAAAADLGEHYAADLAAGALLAETVRTQSHRSRPIIRALSRHLEALHRRVATG